MPGSTRRPPSGWRSWRRTGWRGRSGPVHTPQDGDTVFAIATGKHDLGGDPLALAELGTLAADCLARAVARGVYNAATLGAARGWRDVFGR